jgi:hypothetical protein
MMKYGGLDTVMFARHDWLEIGLSLDSFVVYEICRR